MTYTLGRIPSEPDVRDHQLARYLALGAPLPPSYRTPVRPAILNQGTVPACVGYSGATGRTITEQPDAGMVAFDPLDLYRLCKANDGDPNGWGTSIRVAAQLLRSTGALATSGPAPVKKGERFKIGAYAAVHTVDEIKAAVFANGWAWMGLNWYDSWYRPNENGSLPARYNLVGGHAISIIGWDDVRASFLLQNSWGPKWGVGGTCWIRYNQLEADPELWTVIDAPDCLITVTPFPAPRYFTVHKGQTLTGWNPKGAAKSHHWPRASRGVADAEVSIIWSGVIPAPIPAGPFYRGSAGFYRGLLVQQSEVPLS
jgi:hypothetical protein